MIRVTFLAICASLFGVQQGLACAVKLLISWDVSASMSSADYLAQRDGTAAAFRDPAVQNMVALSPGGVAVSVLQWAGEDEQQVSVPWVMLYTNNDARRFADAIEAMTDPFDTTGGTAIGASLQWSLDHLAAGPACDRTVIDISGDGVSNIGIGPSGIADYLEARGVTINGLVINGPVKRWDQDPFLHYVRHVARGPGSFVMLADSYQDFPRAMCNKLVRELMPKLAFLSTE